MKPALRKWYAEIGSRGGKSSSAKKRRAARRNGRLGQRPHIRKLRVFERVFPYPIESTEWKVRWPIKHDGFSTYNPDYWCPKLKHHIEVVTSNGNFLSSYRTWAKAIRKGFKLLVFWWDGTNITKRVLKGSLGMKMPNTISEPINNSET